MVQVSFALQYDYFKSSVRSSLEKNLKNLSKTDELKKQEN